MYKSQQPQIVCYYENNNLAGFLYNGEHVHVKLSFKLTNHRPFKITDLLTGKVYNPLKTSDNKT